MFIFFSFIILSGRHTTHISMIAIDYCLSLQISSLLNRLILIYDTPELLIDDSNC